MKNEIIIKHNATPRKIYKYAFKNQFKITLIYF